MSTGLGCPHGETDPISGLMVAFLTGRTTDRLHYDQRSNITHGHARGVRGLASSDSRCAALRLFASQATLP
jgi:hypothetical protein